MFHLQAKKVWLFFGFIILVFLVCFVYRVISYCIVFIIYSARRNLLDELSIFKLECQVRKRVKACLSYASMLILIRHWALQSMETPTSVETLDIEPNVRYHCLVKETNFIFPKPLKLFKGDYSRFSVKLLLFCY